MIVVEEREYARLLGYPWGTLLEGLEGEVRERAAQATAWYEEHGKPRVYCTGEVAGITAGGEVDAEVARLWDEGRVDESYFLDRYAAAVVEKMARELGPHASPGCSSKLPFEEQFTLFARLSVLKPEMEMLSSGMLKPKNSLLALVYPNGDAPANPCTACNMPNCSFRRRS